ncbi:hypothetical protein CDAR_49471, partial [Caerostris darwini]
ITIPISADEGPGLWAPPSLLHCSSRECVPAFRFLAAVSSFDSVYEIPLLRFGRRKEKRKDASVCSRGEIKQIDACGERRRGMAESVRK